ncbi:MAG: hypothetical protein GEV28_26700 [Actinophytocola sp.]|uniref:hypothetical protein n=1 Tax=Actinophytocola sp. TaxID=1872138 RepID=UPI001326FC24|nr:hypothetical protein [Actinophytocola sp.]MPZ83787.1 hypothetical protein [Actinophytocola sp.]
MSELAHGVSNMVGAVGAAGDATPQQLARQTSLTAKTVTRLIEVLVERFAGVQRCRRWSGFGGPHVLVSVVVAITRASNAVPHQTRIRE